MRRHTFTRASAWGWAEPLPSRSMAEIRRLFPELEAADVEREFGYFLILTRAEADTPPAHEMKAELDRFRSDVEALHANAAELGRNNLGALIRQTCGLADDYDALNDLELALERMKALLPGVINRAPAGRSIPAQHVLAGNLARLLSDAGLPVDSKPQGHLCVLLGIVLDAAGYPGGARPIARAMLANLA